MGGDDSLLYGSDGGDACTGSLADIEETLLREPRHFGAMAGMALILMQQGRIDQIPAEVLQGDIASDEVWECTRLVTSDRVRTQSERADCLALIVEGLIEIANRFGGIEMVTLTRPSLMRALRQLGFSVSQDGESYFSEADGRRYAVLRMPAMRTSHLIAAE